MGGGETWSMCILSYQVRSLAASKFDKFMLTLQTWCFCLIVKRKRSNI